ncbi:MAG: small ribosomal subunit Rsm22 family protein [Bryobacter sp.]
MLTDQILDEGLAKYGFPVLREAAEKLSFAYRDGKPTKSLRLDGELLALAYLATRFPATQAVAQKVGEETLARLADAPQSLLDLGAGCGATSLGLLAAWPEIDSVTALEQQPAMTALGRRLLPYAAWRSADFRKADLGTHDAVAMGYSLGEDAEALERAWAATRQLLILVEPGTKPGSANLLAARSWLLHNGGHVVAPCPNNLVCPMEGVDWCHFAQRLNRSRLHRQLKGGQLGYEDEKYSYLVVARQEVSAGSPRVVRHPLIAPGRITLDLCFAPARNSLVVTKRDKENFRRARKTAWGEVWVAASEAQDSD